MSITNVSEYASSIYSYSQLSSTEQYSTQVEENEEFAISEESEMPPPPPPPPPSDENSEEYSWDSDDVESFVSYAQNEYGVELDAESILSTYDSDGDGSLSATDVESLLEETGVELPPPPPPTQNSNDEKLGIMSQMQASSGLNSDTITISDYITESEDSTSATDSLLNAINSSSTIDLEADKNAADFVANATVASESTSETSAETLINTIKEQVANAYDSYSYLESGDISSFLA